MYSILNVYEVMGPFMAMAIVVVVVVGGMLETDPGGGVIRPPD
jgi:hypothetical protein